MYDLIFWAIWIIWGSYFAWGVAGFVRSGRMTRYVGFSFWRTLLRVGYRAFLTLDPVQAAGLFCGYYGDWIRRRPRIDDREIRDAVRRYQWM